MEFAIVAAAFVSVLVALGALRRSLESGSFVDHALTSASHHVQGVLAGGIADVFLY